MTDGNKIPKRGRSFGANATMSDVKCAHIPKFALTNVSDEDLKKLQRISERMLMRKNIDYYVWKKRR